MPAIIIVALLVWCSPFVGAVPGTPSRSLSNPAAPIALHAGDNTYEVDPQRGLRTLSKSLQGGLRTVSERLPRLYFLLLAYDRIYHEDVWASFLHKGIHGEDYVALVHCELEDACRRNINNQSTFRVISSVPSVYCKNTVDAQLALVAAALELNPHGSPEDKFILTSHNALPVKSLNYIQEVLQEDGSMVSRFGIMEGKECGLKGSQWSILCRAHAAHLLDQRGVLPVELFEGCDGCTDEWWFLAAILGFRAEDVGDEVKAVSDVYIGWSHMGEQLNASTFASTLLPAEYAASNKHRAFGNAAGIYGPATIIEFDAFALELVRKSTYLFLRKVDETTTYQGNMSLQEAFDKFFFS